MIPIIQITITFNHHIIFFIETYLIIQKSFDLEKIWIPKLNQIFYKGHNSKMGMLLKVFAIPSLSHFPFILGMCLSHDLHWPHIELIYLILPQWCEIFEINKISLTVYLCEMRKKEMCNCAHISFPSLLNFFFNLHHDIIIEHLNPW